jgi:glutamate-1-semialdehyde 2,1-aminomutase
MGTTDLQSRTITELYAERFPTSNARYQEARAIFPGGVTHDLRYLEPFPIYIQRAEGAYKWDLDGNRLIDYWAGHGALLLGHSHPKIVKAVQHQMALATHPGACHELEIEWGRWVKRLVPSAEKIRFVSSGTEATLMALRLARMFTGRPRVLKFAGHFHGWHDFLIPAADYFDSAPSPGVLPGIAAETVVVQPNSPEAVERALANDPQIGCVILEPTGGHFGSVPIRGPFLKELRGITNKHGRLLIFDEVITGFRVHPGGAQGHYCVTPDLTTLAKVLAGGLPGGCLAGRADVLAGLEYRPGQPKMKHPGTFNGNPLSAAAGVAALSLVSNGEPCRQANAMGQMLRQGLNRMFVERGFDWIAYGEFSSFKLIPGYQGPRSSADNFIPYAGNPEKLEARGNPKLAHLFRQGLLLHGIDMPGLGGMTTAAHQPADVEETVKAVAETIEQIQIG